MVLVLIVLIPVAIEPYSNIDGIFVGGVGI